MNENFMYYMIFLLGEGGEENRASTDQTLDEAAGVGLEGGIEEEEEEDDDVVDLRAFSAIGPVMIIELLDLPPQPKLANGWIMQQSKGSYKYFSIA